MSMPSEKPEPKELTEDAVRAKLLQYVWGLVEYWEKESRATKTREKLSGLAFSILSTLDGSAMELPAFIVAPSPHKDDRGYHWDHGENWFPENNDVNVACDLGGSLHEFFHEYDPSKPKES